jgi:hypothetical protein
MMPNITSKATRTAHASRADDRPGARLRGQLRYRHVRPARHRRPRPGRVARQHLPRRGHVRADAGQALADRRLQCLGSVQPLPDDRQAGRLPARLLYLAHELHQPDQPKNTSASST